jgi:hypothetical protein
MTVAQANAAASSLKAIATKWGVRTSIELRSGRGTDPWGVYTKYLRFWHHTATYYKPTNLTPSLYICKNGRSDVPGPLCNGYLGYDLVFRIICMGEANHPGLGGPITIDGVYVPKNSARKPTFGIECEGGYQSWEEIDRLGPDMLQAMGRLDCALMEWTRRPITSQLEHKTWAPTRKVDRKDFDAARVRGIALSKKWYAVGTGKPPTPPTGDWLDMVTEAQFKAALRAYTSAWLVRPKKEDGTIMSNVFIVANDFSSKYWVGDWAVVKVVDFIEDLNDAGKDAAGNPKPHNFDWRFIQQIPEQWNPALGYSFAPLPTADRWKNTPPPDIADHIKPEPAEPVPEPPTPQ